MGFVKLFTTKISIVYLPFFRISYTWLIVNVPFAGVKTFDHSIWMILPCSSMICCIMYASKLLSKEFLASILVEIDWISSCFSLSLIDFEISIFSKSINVSSFVVINAVPKISLLSLFEYGLGNVLSVYCA